MDRTTIIKISRASTIEYSSSSSPEQNLRVPQNTPNDNNQINMTKENAVQCSQNCSFQVCENDDFQDDTLNQYDILKQKFLQLQDEHRRLMGIIIVN